MAEIDENLDWREAVRKRPAMYVGSLSLNGFSNHLKLILQNIFFHTNSNYFSIDFSDTMCGKVVFYNIKSSIRDDCNENLSLSNFELPVFNALCKEYEFLLYNESRQILLKQTYKNGLLEKGKIEEKEFFAQSMEIHFTLDDSIWNFDKVNFYQISDKIRDFAFLCKDKQFEISYLENNEKSRLLFSFKNGLLDKLDLEDSKGWGEANFINYSEKQFSDFSLELAFGLSHFFYHNKFLGSYVNFAETTDHGTHVIGLIKGVKKGLKKYIKKHLPDKKVLIKNSAIKKSLFSAIHIKIPKPIFWGPTKGKLQNPEVIKPISKYVSNIVLLELEKDKKFAEDFLRHFVYY